MSMLTKWVPFHDTRNDWYGVSNDDPNDRWIVGLSNEPDAQRIAYVLNEREFLRASLDAAQGEVERLKKENLIALCANSAVRQGLYDTALEQEGEITRLESDRDTAIARAEKAESDAKELREVLGKVLSKSRETYDLERDHPGLIARATALAAAPMSPPHLDRATVDPPPRAKR